MQALIEQIKRQAAAVASSIGTLRWGFVASVDPSRPAVRVRVMPEDVLTGWLPVLQNAAGAGISVVTVPQVGWQAAMMPDAGQAEHYVLLGFAHSDMQPLPQVAADINASGTTPLAPGETLLIGPDGGVFLRISGAVAFLNGDLHVQGNIVATGDISDRADVRGTVNALRDAYNEHGHPGVQRGGDVTDTTNHPVS